jgi:DNA-binding PadR family transcriptional regulator
MRPLRRPRGLLFRWLGITGRDDAQEVCECRAEAEFSEHSGPGPSGTFASVVTTRARASGCISRPAESVREDPTTDTLMEYTVYMSMRVMREATFLILTALAGGSRHGYGIITDVEHISGGRVRLRAGTLYAAVDRLRVERLIEVDHEEILDNRLRRYYRLSPAGRARLATEANRLQASASVAMSRLAVAGGLP